MTATPTKPQVQLRHEEFCTPRPNESEPRIESFPYYADDPGSGRSRVTHRITRCLECGASHYQKIGL